MAFAGPPGPTQARAKLLTPSQDAEVKTSTGMLGMMVLGFGVKGRIGMGRVRLGSTLSGSMGGVLATPTSRPLNQRSSGRSTPARCPPRVSLNPTVPIVAGFLPGPGPHGGSLPSRTQPSDMVLGAEDAHVTTPPPGADPRQGLGFLGAGDLRGHPHRRGKVVWGRMMRI